MAPSAPSFRGIPSLPAAFGGFDRTLPPEEAWMEAVLHKSNFSFTWAYMSHWPNGPRDEQGGKTQELWKKKFPALIPQGWGFVLTFLAVSQRPLKVKKTGNLDDTSWDSNAYKPSAENLKKGNATTKEPVKLGTEHAKLLKGFLVGLGNEAQGAVVIVDNEDQNPLPGHLEQILRPEVLEYYDALFTELRIPGDEGLVVRPGLYAREQPMIQIIAHNKANQDLFLWCCDIKEGNPDTNVEHPKRPYVQSGGRLFTPIDMHKVNAIVYQDERLKRTALVLGRQWLLYDHDKEVMPDGNLTRVIKQTAGWDFNTSLVRDTRYPIAVPRIAVSEQIRLRSVFNPDDEIDKETKLVTTKIEQMHSVKPTMLPFTGMSELVEHEAPLLLVDAAYKSRKPSDNQGPPLPGTDLELFTLDKAGQIVVISAAAGGNPAGTLLWSHPTSILPDESLQLRRNRSMVAIKRSGYYYIDTQIFFVSAEHILRGVRRYRTATWTNPAVLVEGIHPFSNIAAVVRGKDSVDIFYIDSLGRLSTAWWPTSDKDWPGTHHQPLQDLSSNNGQPTLFMGTSIATVSPSETRIVVFAIGNDSNLHMAAFDSTTGRGWSPLAAIPGLKKEDDHLFPHARMDAYAASPTLIYVATITEVNIPCLYKIELDGKTWVLRKRDYFPNDPDRKVVVDTKANFEAAPKYEFNPFGDIKLSMVDGRLVFWIPGVVDGSGGLISGDRVAVLFRKVLLKDKEVEVWKRVK
jgi:hypothetical protein